MIRNTDIDDQDHKSEVEKVKRVSGNLSIGPETFCKNEEVRHEKIIFCPQMDFRAT